ncbi:MAG: SprB repeat-containing protein, partial [Flavobacteriales bacterium]|nr:SprB repeat-containing protein [Flavobacteriales bacterium]
MLNRVLILLGLLISLNLFSFQKATASHSMGVDLTYICLGNNEFVFTISFYRDCSGISAPASANLNLASASCGQNFTVNLPQISSMEISALCPTALSTCQGGAQPGAEQYIYSDTITLPAQCTDWIFSWSHCCRNPLITNLTSPSSQNIYIEATYNNTVAGCNSSPLFTTLPVPYICDGQPYSYNHGAIDIDGDSLVYTLVNPLTSGAASIAYQPGFTPTVPITTISGTVPFDGATGQMSIVPNGAQVAVVTILIEEYRNGVLIGSTMRDIQIIVLNCGNQQPQLDLPGVINLQNGTLLDTMSIEACVGSNLVFNLSASDPDNGDIITMTTNAGLALTGMQFGASGANPVTGNFTWTPQLTDLGFNTFTVTIQDDGCPVLGTQIYVVEINITNGTFAGSDYFLCDGDTAQLSVSGGTSFQWTPSTALSNDTISNPLAWPSSTQTYTVTSDMTGSCGNQDDITVFVVTPFTLNTTADVILCNSGAAQLSAVAGPPDNYVYSWSPSIGLDFDTVPNPLASPTETTVYTVSVTSSSGCTRTTTQMVTVAPTPLSTAPTIDDVLLCKGSSTMVHANVDAGDCNAYVVAQVPYAPVGGSGTSITLGDDALSAALPLGFSFNFFCNNYSNFYISSNGYIGFATGSNGCCTGQVLPNGTLPNNLIAFAWEDLSPQTGTIDYFTTGTSPNQICVINFMNVPHFGSNNMVSTQILLYEGSNQIDIHTQEMSSDGGAHTMGIENANGTIGFPVLGRNSTNWSASNEGMRFAPMTPPPFVVTWFDSDSNIVGTTEDVLVTPDTATTYSILITDGACTNIQTVSVEVSGANAGPDTAMCLGDTVPLSAFYFGPTGADAPTSCGPSTSSCISAGVSTTVGTGTSVNNSTTYPAPYGNWFRNAKHQILYTAADLLAAGVAPGKITDIGFFINSISGTSLYSAFSISLGCTQLSNLTTWQTGLTTVYTPKNYTITTGLNNHVLDVPYDWDGTTNLIMELCYNNLSSSFTNNSSSPYTVTGYTSVLYYRSDGTPACPFTGSPTTSSNRPNTSFTVCTDSLTPVFTWTPSVDLSDSTSAFPMASPSVPTTYVVTIDNGICQVTDTVLVTPSDLVLVSAVTGETCSGMCDGAATVIPSGIAPYTYVWSDVDTQITSSATGLCAGVYSVSVTDASGCTGVRTDTVPNGNILTTAVQNITNATCFSACDGAATMATVGGIPPYTYLWNDSQAQTTLTATGLCAATYIFTMVDSAGCFVIDSVVITEPTSILTSTNVTCMGACNGLAVVAPQGGLPPYTYLWDDSLAQTSPVAGGLCAGTYISSVTDSNGCTVFDTVQVNAPYTTVSGTVCSDLSCNGAVTVTPVGGSGPYTFQWDDPSNQTDSTATSLCPGSYTVQVWDGTGCIMNDTILIATPLVSAITDSIMVTCDGACDGAGTVTPVGGQGPFSYLWNDINGQTDSTAVSLCDGIYAVQITDANNCVDTSTVIITSPAALILQTAASCFGVCDGSAGVSTVGGTAPYTYLWDDPAGQTDSVATGLCGGNYAVTVTDANACQILESTTILTPSTQLATVDATCQGLCDGEASATPVGGLAPYTYLWDDPAAQTNSQATNLCVGWVYVDVIDATGCQVLDSIRVGEASPIGLVQDTVTDISCFGLCDGTLSYLVPSEGAAPFSYEWYDISGVALGNQTLNASGLCQGSYYLEFTDGAGCMTTDTVTLTQPAELQTSIDSISHVKCAGDCNGVGGVAVSGGTSPFTYAWSDPTAQNVPLATNLCGGKWYVTITDAQSCMFTDSVIINSPAKLLAPTDTTRLHCTFDCDGSVTVNASGGWEPYTYVWDDPALQTTAMATGLCLGDYTVTV